jgi:hypothetical protein
VTVWQPVQDPSTSSLPGASGSSLTASSWACDGVASAKNSALAIDGTGNLDMIDLMQRLTLSRGILADMTE